MPQFFIKAGAVKGNKIIIEGGDYHHLINVRRINRHDIIDLRDDEGNLLTSRVTKIGEHFIETEIVNIKSNKDISIELTLCISLLKGKNFDLVIRKAVEIGVSRIIPVISERTIPVPGDKKSKKHERWNRVAIEAAKQSLRRDIPVINYTHTFNELLDTDSSELNIIAHPGANRNIGAYLKDREEKKSISLLIGPEGGFSPGELNAAERNNWVSLNFGFTHLRAETAAIVLPSILIYEWSLNIDNRIQQ